jgi:ABC-type uncharacterized transport system substrate-binding protein
MVSMDRWLGKVIIVTGANSGIGAAIEKQLVEEGLNVKNSNDFLPVTNCCVMGLRPFVHCNQRSGGN